MVLCAERSVLAVGLFRCQCSQFHIAFELLSSDRVHSLHDWEGDATSEVC